MKSLRAHPTTNDNGGTIPPNLDTKQKEFLLQVHTVQICKANPGGWPSLSCQAGTRRPIRAHP